MRNLRKNLSRNSSHLPLKKVEKQRHDNQTYRLGSEMLIRLPSAPEYSEKVLIEQSILPKLKVHLIVQIQEPIKIGVPSETLPYYFSIYKWLEGKSLNFLSLNDEQNEILAFDLAEFLKELQGAPLDGPEPGEHNFWRGGHISVYNQDFREQVS
jgi:aminoglycoside phosphotransferase (APT) family kinase protein